MIGIISEEVEGQGDGQVIDENVNSAGQKNLISDEAAKLNKSK